MNYLKIIKEIIILSLGTFIFSVSINNFIIPFNLGEGGVTGITVISYYLFETPTWLVNLALNSMLLIFGYKLLNKKTMVYTILSTFLFSLFLKMTADPFFVFDDILVSSIVSGVFSGVGLGLVIKSGGTTAGSTLLALIMNKILGWNISYGMLFFDLIVVFSGSFIIGFENTVYTIIMLFICTKVLDYILVGIYSKNSITIISDKYEEIGNCINKELNRGVTVFSGTGFYSKKDKRILLVIVNKKQVNNVKKIINKLDPNAIITIQEVKSAFGNGFDKLT